MDRIFYESHMHTPLCNHAEGEPGDYAEAAQHKGLKGIIVTCHSPLPDGHSAGVRMRPDQWEEYQELVAAARDSWKGKVDIRLGLESDYVPGMEAWIEKLHASADLNHVLGSLHPFLKEYTSIFLDTDKPDWPTFHELYFTHLADAAETGLFDTLAHPDIVKNQGIDQWDLPARLPHIQRCLDRIAASGTAMELNTSGLNKKMPEMNPSTTILREMNSRNIPVVLGADAHNPRRVADRYPEALKMLKDCGFSQVRVFLERTPHDFSIDDVLASLTETHS